MTDKKTEALKLALEYLRDNQHYIAENERHAYVMEYNAFVERLEALAHAPTVREQPAQQQPDDFLLRGILASELKSRHRLTKYEAQNLAEFVQNTSTHPAQPKQWVDAGNLKQLKAGDRVRVFYKGVEDVEFTLGANAYDGTSDGAFYGYLTDVSGYLGRRVGARVDAETGAVYADRSYKVEVLK